MKVSVTAQAFDRENGSPIGFPRTEKINTKTNRLFAGAKTHLDVIRIFEAFWNDMNSTSKEVVKISYVTIEI